MHTEFWQGKTLLTFTSKTENQLKGRHQDECERNREVDGSQEMAAVGTACNTVTCNNQQWAVRCAVGNELLTAQHGARK
jgi:hypothetical protein